MQTAACPAQSREAGQAIILIVVAFIGLLAAVGIVVDLGRYLVLQAQLRRAADAAALAGAAQFRLAGSTTTDAVVYDKVNKATRTSLIVHGVATPTLASGVSVTTCRGDGSTPATIEAGLCTSPPTKKVRVVVSEDMPLVFLRLVGIESVSLSAESTTEAAAVDVALAIDISDSMGSDGCGAGGNYQCVYDCDNVVNPYNTDCHPFQEVKSAALAFLDYLSPGYDRVTVIPFGLEAGYCYKLGDVWPFCAVSAYNDYVPLTTDLNVARTFITNLDIAIPPWASDPPYTRPPSPGLACPGYDDNPPAGASPNDWDPRLCTNTNVGGGVRASATELLKEFDPTFGVVDPKAGPNHPSKERLRVIILLTDGAANASGLGAEGPTYSTPLQQGYCPQSTWYSPPPAGPFCRASSPVLAGPGRHISTSVEYDSVDYALDWADFAMLESPVGNGIVMFTIGLGDQVISAPRGQPDIGERLLRYIAAGGDDAKLTTDPCASVATGTSCGNYYFAPTGAELLNVFKAIAGRIFTRINR
jgi:Flp pilus assembly protein TadG